MGKVAYWAHCAEMTCPRVRAFARPRASAGLWRAYNFYDLLLQKRSGLRLYQPAASRKCSSRATIAPSRLSPAIAATMTSSPTSIAVRSSRRSCYAAIAA